MRYMHEPFNPTELGGGLHWGICPEKEAPGDIGEAPGTVTLQAMHLLSWLGCQEIDLAGCELYWEPDRPIHFYESLYSNPFGDDKLKLVRHRGREVVTTWHWHRSARYIGHLLPRFRAVTKLNWHCDSLILDYDGCAEPYVPVHSKELPPLQDYLESWRATTLEQAYAGVDLPERTRYLVARVQDYLPPGAKVLELGSGCGRNLAGLQAAGYQVQGIEIAPANFQVMREKFASVAECVIMGALEDVVRKLPDNSVDAIVTMAVLMHLHPDSEWVLRELTRISRKWLLLIERSSIISPRCFARNYQEIFQQLGCRLRHTEIVPCLPEYNLYVLEVNGS